LLLTIGACDGDRHTVVDRRGDGFVKESALADARRTIDQDHPTAVLGQGRDPLLQDVELASPAAQGPDRRVGTPSGHGRPLYTAEQASWSRDRMECWLMQAFRLCHGYEAHDGPSTTHGL
jgi:hypothetical protein